MASLTRNLLTSFSKGELTQLLEGRPDLAAFYEGLLKAENWNIMRQGGLDRRPGTRMICEVKDSTKDTILLPFEKSTVSSFIVELGDLYARFIKNKAQLLSGAPPYEIVSPYTEAQLRDIHSTQSVDVGFLFHPDVAPQNLNHIADLNWSMVTIAFDPPATFEADTDISAGHVTLTPGATTGSDITFTASTAVFLKGDVGRRIIFEASEAIITQIGASAGSPSPQATVLVDIITDFPNTDPIPAGEWKLRLSPQASLDPDKKNPVGGQIRLETAGTVTFRAEDLGKYIFIYGGLLKITRIVSSSSIRAKLLSPMDGATEGDPPLVAAGAWKLVVPSWSTQYGFPATGEFFQGRLGAAATYEQPTTFWLSASDSFRDFAAGIAANRAIEYTMATKGLNAIQWMVDNEDLFLGTGGTEHDAKGGRTDEPIGGDQIPLVNKLSNKGSAHIQSIPIDGRILFIDRSRRQIFSIAYNIEEDGFKPFEVTGAAEHITESGIRLGPIGYQIRPDPRLYFVREDGQLITLTYFHQEKVIGFTRYKTDGFFTAVAVIPQPVTFAGYQDQVFVIVERAIDGAIKKFIEMFEPEAAEVVGRGWSSLQTDCASVFTLGGVSTTIFAVPHLIGKTVDVVADGTYIGTKVVDSAGNVTLDQEPFPTAHVEIGLHYDSIAQTMRPAVTNQMVEGLPRTWIKLWLRVKDTIGGKVMGQNVKYKKEHIASNRLATGDANITAMGVDKDDGKVTFTQDQPYPMKVLAMFGEITFGDHG